MLSTAAVVFILVSVTFALPSDFKLPKLKEAGTQWALLVAGSNGWGNYRHQADVCHAYNIVRGHGVPEEQIIVMMYDDIAYNKENPNPGEIINQPGGENVYKGVKIDYRGKDVNPTTFLNVLQGKEENVKGIGSGKVLKSKSTDNVFVNFVDHGAPGLIAFPDEFLHAVDLNIVLDRMHDNKQYHQLLFYLETCESGSMFSSLLRKDYNILAVTAANSTQSSFACYFDTKLRTFLGDLFSVNWMQNSDNRNLNSETIDEQFSIVRKETNKSHVMEFGDLAMNQLMLSNFLGSEQNNHIVLDAPNPNLDAVPSEDVDITIQRNIYQAAKEQNDKKEMEESWANIAAIMKKREETDSIIKQIVSLVAGDWNFREQYQMLTGENDLFKLDCYAPIVEHLKDSCGDLDLPSNRYSLKHLRIVVNLCERPYSTDAIISAIDKVCV
ncbi:legumain-like [Mizuhopecten yessoensis]|uniref:Hemoglobinase n=1 Tax=Mizuhopecten yessoensis TaxID=6573 RepID=A0A210QNN0_MIZYE|nr:legumain-like [Mizuhopecten yessoensis]OWF50347.1 Legumain [Mizuhopecten yessoensis]